MYAPLKTQLIHRIAGIAARAWRVLRNRHQARKLNDLTDAQLADIGLTRGDVRTALAAPFFRDPSFALTKASQRNTHAPQVKVPARIVLIPQTRRTAATVAAGSNAGPQIAA